MYNRKPKAHQWFQIIPHGSLPAYYCYHVGIQVYKHDIVGDSIVVATMYIVQSYFRKSAPVDVQLYFSYIIVKYNTQIHLHCITF